VLLLLLLLLSTIK